MQKNVLYISYDGMTDNLGQSQVIPYLKELTKKGYNFTILSFEKPCKYSLKKDDIKKQLNKYGIKWHPLLYTSKPPVLSTIKDIIKLVYVCKKLHKKTKFNIVHCRSYVSAFGGLVLKRKFGVKFVFDMRGFWADERIDGNIWNKKNILFKMVYKFFKKQEIKYLTKADYTISLTSNGKNEIHKWQTIKNNPIPIEVIPCCADLEHFNTNCMEPSKIKELKNKLNILETDFVLSYLGSIGTWYMLNQMLDFFKELLIAKPNSKFLFITTDNKKQILNKAKQKGISAEKILIHPATRSEVPLYIAISQLSIFFIKPLFSKKASSPTKLAELMGMGIPVICNANVGDVDEIIKTTNSGFVINSFNKNEYKTAIINIPKLINTNKIEIRQQAKNMFSLNIGVEKYAKVYKYVLNT